MFIHFLIFFHILRKYEGGTVIKWERLSNQMMSFIVQIIQLLKILEERRQRNFEAKLNNILKKYIPYQIGKLREFKYSQ